MSTTPNGFSPFDGPEFVNTFYSIEQLFGIKETYRNFQ